MRTFRLLLAARLVNATRHVRTQARHPGAYAVPVAALLFLLQSRSLGRELTENLDGVTRFFALMFPIGVMARAARLEPSRELVDATAASEGAKLAAAAAGDIARSHVTILTLPWPLAALLAARVSAPTKAAFVLLWVLFVFLESVFAQGVARAAAATSVSLAVRRNTLKALVLVAGVVAFLGGEAWVRVSPYAVALDTLLAGRPHLFVVAAWCLGAALVTYGATQIRPTHVRPSPRAGAGLLRAPLPAWLARELVLTLRTPGRLGAAVAPLLLGALAGMSPGLEGVSATLAGVVGATEATVALYEGEAPVPWGVLPLSEADLRLRKVAPVAVYALLLAAVFPGDLRVAAGATLAALAAANVVAALTKNQPLATRAAGYVAAGQAALLIPRLCSF